MIKLVHVFSAPQSAYFFMRGQLEYMHNKGIELTVSMPSDIEVNEKFKQREPFVKVINIAFVRDIAVGSDLVSLFKLIKIFKALKPDIIHLHTPKASLLGALAGRALFKSRIIYQMHGLISIEGNNVQKGLMYEIEKLTCLLSTKIFAVSESLKSFAIANNYCKSKKISVINNGTINGIDYINKFNPETVGKDKEELNSLVSKKFIIGFVGRLLDAKGIEDYIKVLANFKKNRISFLGFVIGPDESGTHFNNLLQQYGLIIDKDIILFGQQLNPEKFMVYFDVLLLPTKREGFGLVAAEANALNIPVVGYDIPGFRDAVLSGETGILVEYGDSNKLFDAVFKYYHNQELRFEHGKNGRERVIRDFKSEDIWMEVFEEYQKLLN